MDYMEAAWPSGLGHTSCNPEVSGSSPPPYSWICSQWSRVELWSVSWQLGFLTKLCLFVIFVSQFVDICPEKPHRGVVN